MITAAWTWASANGRLRRNPIHQEEEALLVLSESFQLLDETGSEINMSGTMEVEANRIHDAGNMATHIGKLGLKQEATIILSGRVALSN